MSDRNLCQFGMDICQFRIDILICPIRIYVHSELTYVRSEFMSIPNGHMSDRNIWYTKYNHCKYALVTKNVNDFSSGEKDEGIKIALCKNALNYRRR